MRGLKADGFFSFLAFGSFDKEVKGLNELPSDEFLRKIYPTATAQELSEVRPQYWAPVGFCFQTFRIMVYLGVAIAVFVMFGFWLWIRNKLFDTENRWTRLFWKWSVLSFLMPIIACQVGWAVAEVGRQPWIVWHVLKTSDAVTTTATSGEVLFSIILFSAIFLLIAILAVWVLCKKIKAVAGE